MKKLLPLSNFFYIRSLDDKRVYVANTQFIDKDNNSFSSSEDAKKYLIDNDYIEVSYNDTPSDLNYWIKK